METEEQFCRRNHTPTRPTHSPCNIPIKPNLEFKTRPLKLFGSLPLDMALLVKALQLLGFSWCYTHIKLCSHGQTLADRTNPGPSFQLQKWLHAYHALTAQCANMTQLRVENSAHTTFRLSSIRYCGPRCSACNAVAVHVCISMCILQSL